MNQKQRATFLKIAVFSIDKIKHISRTTNFFVGGPLHTIVNNLLAYLCFVKHFPLKINLFWIFCWIRKISAIHTFVNIPALIRKRIVFLSSRARILTKVWIRNMLFSDKFASLNLSIDITYNFSFLLRNTTAGENIAKIWKPLLSGEN